MTTDSPTQDVASVWPLDRPVPLHPLTFLDEGSEVTVGRPDIDVYCVLEPDAAALIGRLADGVTPQQAASWYLERYGEPVDLPDFLAAIDELEFIAHTGDEVVAPTAVRWQRLGRAAFSRLAIGGYVLLLALAAAVMLRHPDLAPQYRNLLFTPYLTVIELTIFFGQMPLLLAHEAFHALAGRRLGLHSTLGIGRRLNFVVFETRMDGLVAVPRAKRVLPMLAGMLADLLVIAVFTLIAAALRRPDGTMPLVGGVLLALTFGTLLRFVWQFYFYLETDLYHLVAMLLGCVNLQQTARQMLANRARRLIRRPERCTDESTWHPRDRAVARWYSWLLLGGYAVSLATLLLAAIPPLVVLSARFVHQLEGHAPLAHVIDAVVLVALNVGQALLLIGIAVRDRRRRVTYSHVIS